MVQTFKKAVSTFVTLTTVAWSVGAGVLAMPTSVSAAVSAGDLIKASGPAVYYLGADGARHVFPNEQTYKSWYANFNGVKTISDAELASIPLAQGSGANVTTRPGTKLVKITTDPKTYAVTKGGVLHWIQSEALAKALYGDNWAQRVVDVSDAFFANYTTGSPVTSNVHPDGTLVMYAGDSSTYVVWNGMKRKFASDAAFSANGYDKANAILTTISYGNGSDVTGREGDLADTISGGTGGTWVSGGLTVSLASDAPAGMTVPRNASSVPLVKVNLMAGNGDVRVTGLHFHRFGIGAVADFSSVYLYDGSGKRLTTGRTINTTSNMVEFNNLSLTISSGNTASVYIYGDFAGTSATVGGQHGFELVDASGVLVDGSSTISGSYPVRGNVFTVGSTNSARVDVQKGILPANPNIGAKGAEISNFKVTANTNDVELKQVTLYQAGTVSNSDLSNFKLYQGTTLVASAPSVASDGRIFMKFTTPFLITNGTTKVFSLTADIGGRAGRTIRTYVEYTTDVTAIDKVYNAGAQICTVTGTPAACTGTANFDGAGTNYIEVTTQGGQLTNNFNGPSTMNIAKGQLAVPLYKFSLTSSDNALEIRKMVFTIATVSAGCKVQGVLNSTNYFRSVKIKNLDNGQTVMGPQEFSGTGGATTKTLTYTDSFNINKAQTMNLALVADLANSEDATNEFFASGTCVYTASFAAFGSNDVRVVDTGEFLDTSKIVPNSSVTGNSLTVKSSALDISLASSPSSDTLVKKQKDVAVAGFVLTASAQSDVTVTNLTLGAQANLATSGCNGNAFGGAACNLSNVSQRITSLALYNKDTGAQVGLAKAPDSTTGKSQITNMNLLIPKGSSVTLLAKATFGSSASTTSPYDKVAVGIAAVADVQAQDQDSNTVTPTLSSAVTAQATGASPAVVQTILNSGTITLQNDSHPVTNIVVAGKDAWVTLAQYKATAQNEDITIDRVAVLASSTAGFTSDNADFVQVAVQQGGALKGWDILPSGATGTKDVDLTSNPIVVPKDGSVQFQIMAKLSSITPSSSQSQSTSGVARSGHAPALGINSSLTFGEWDTNYASKLNIRSTGAASGERVYAATTGATQGNVQIMRKTKPTVTRLATSGVLASGADQDLIKFNVAPDTAGSVAWKQITLTVSKTANVALSSLKLRRGTDDLSDTIVSIRNATSAADLASGSIPAGVNNATIVVSFKAGQEESVTGSGYDYTLHGTVTSSGTGNSITTQFLRDTTSGVVTGYLANGAFGIFANSTDIFHIDTSTAGTGVAAATGTFVWSDNSVVPHGHALGTAGGSSDWINDLYVKDLTGSNTLSN